jgi:hypothetical protein
MYTSVSVAGLDSPVELPAFLDGFRAIHRAMRRDAATRGPRARVGDQRRARRLARWYGHFLASIEHHHQREDLVVWPLLVDRDPSFAAETAALQHDHEVLDDALHSVARALCDLVDGTVADPGLLVATATRLRHHLDEHLDREEAAAFPRIARSFTADEYHEVEKELREGLSMSELAFEAPWILDGLAAEQAEAMIGEVPVALRVLYYLAFRPRYQRIAAVLGRCRDEPAHHRALDLDLDTIVDTAARFITTEYTPADRGGRPITWPVTPYRGENGTLDVSTGLTYPLKAERARRDRRVALSFTFPAGSGLAPAPVIAVQGLATVRDRDLVATSGRYVRESKRGSRAVRLDAGVDDASARLVLDRMWVEVTPTRVLWWEGGDLTSAPQQWLAPDGTDAPPSDPPPAGMASARGVRRDRLARTNGGVLERLGLPVLTVVDESGSPLPLKVRAARSTADGFAVVPPVGIEVRPGPAFLSFHTHGERFDGQENVGLSGTASVGTLPSGETEVWIRVDRALADFGVPATRCAMLCTCQSRAPAPARLEAEAARRDTTVPRFDELAR